GGTVSSAITDIYPNPISPFAFEVNYKNVQRLIGQEIPIEEIKALILALGIVVTAEEGDTIQVEVPAYKVDVTREVDVTEEVLRIYGYNNIALKSQILASLNTQEKPDREAVLNQIADLLIANGYREILSNSLTKLAYADDEATAVKLFNPLSSDLHTMRQNILFSALTAIAYNQKRKQSDLKFFEYGKTYHLKEEGYEEKQHLALAITGKKTTEKWYEKVKEVNFYNLKAAVDTIVRRLKIENLQIVETTSKNLAYGLDYMKGQKVLVTLGAVAAEALHKADV